MNTAKLNALLSQFHKTVEFPDFVASDSNYYCFSINDSLMLELKYNPDNDFLDFFLQLGLIHPDHKDEVIIEILDANVLWRGTGGVTLGQDSATGMVTLSFQESVDSMSYQRFEQILETVVSAAEYWSHRIAGENLDETALNSAVAVAVPDPQWIKS